MISIIHPKIAPYSQLTPNTINTREDDLRIVFPCRFALYEVVRSFPVSDSAAYRLSTSGKFHSHANMKAALSDYISGFTPAIEALSKRELSGLKYFNSSGETVAEALEVSGHRPSVPDYICNSPESMFSLKKTQGATPSLSLVVNGSSAHYITRESRLNLGVAVTEFIDSLEEKGVQCDLTVSYPGNFSYLHIGGRRIGQIEILIELKHIRERLNTLECVTILSMSDVFRRMIFSIYANIENKSFPTSPHLRKLSMDRYGHPKSPEISESLKTETLVIDRITDNASFETIEEARSVLEYQLSEFIAKNPHLEVRS